MNQQTINQVEWSEPRNWSGPTKWLSVYFSKLDSRVWVPKQIPMLGWTLNFGRSASIAWLAAVILGIVLAVIGVNIMVLAAGAAG